MPRRTPEQIRQGAFYGWPWYTVGDREDPARAGERPDLRGEVRVPEVLLQAHSSALGVAVQPGTVEGPRRHARSSRPSSPNRRVAAPFILARESTTP